jgi:serine/threonine protein kinase
MPNDPQDLTADVTIATELTDTVPAARGQGGSGAPGDPARPEEDRTVFADPVEQAILVDRTREPALPPGAPPDARGAPGDTVVADMRDATVITSDTAIRRALRARTGKTDRSQSDGEDGDGEGDPDNLFGNYRVVAPLAGSGAIPRLLAEHATLGFPVAIKMLPPALIGSTDAENLFFAEAMVASRIAHRGVPMVVDFGYDQRGIAYLAMEYLEGETLGARLAGGGTFTLEQVLTIGVQVAAVLAAAHGVGVQHGAIRPDTIHLSPDPAEPGGLRVKVLDFGVFDRATQADWFRAPELPSRGPHGTGATGAPAPPVEPAVDLYSLGCVLYQLLAGRPPLDGTDAQVADRLRVHDAPPPHVHRADIPWPFGALVHRMVSRRPEARPASAADVERELRALLVGAPASEEGGAAWSRAAQWGSRSAHRAGLSFQSAWRSIGPRARALGARAIAAARRAAVQHPRWSVAVIAAVLFAMTFGLILLIR